ncbi:hypothetical protein KBB96_17700 [Luteolibacter ambystomatis]|uniref:Uncharacterized protein n=2 Tax=Luteolibacter ambystomatis TaxID=2824561 RepID=A0A975G8G3_9BACT|nr:hypothetical protein [Luteolibacter ambystomatis]QUE50681.1 hypothetical protein KBB96_17700 [Luteolibacter ambystomatis]
MTRQSYSDWDMASLDAVKGIPEVERKREGAGANLSSPWAFDPGPHEMTFGYIGKRGYELELLKAGPWIATIDLTAGHHYKVSPAMSPSGMRFRVTDETTGKIVRESQGFPIHTKQIRPRIPMIIPVG